MNGNNTVVVRINTGSLSQDCGAYSAIGALDDDAGADGSLSSVMVMGGSVHCRRLQLEKDESCD